MFHKSSFVVFIDNLRLHKSHNLVEQFNEIAFTFNGTIAYIHTYNESIYSQTNNDDHGDAHGYKRLIMMTNDGDSVIIFGFYCPIH